MLVTGNIKHYPKKEEDMSANVLEVNNNLKEFDEKAFEKSVNERLRELGNYYEKQCEDSDGKEAMTMEEIEEEIYRYHKGL